MYGQLPNNNNGVTFGDDEYLHALWMTTRFYGGQRSSNANDPGDRQTNWLLQDYLPDRSQASSSAPAVPENLRGLSFIDDQDPADGYDLSGGWFDCGDHVKFGQSQFYSAYMLVKGYDEFPEGYPDIYSEAYQGYRSAGDYSFAGENGIPNGIPDVLDEMRHEGNGGLASAGQAGGDHTHRESSVSISVNPQNEGGSQRPVRKNPNDGVMPSFAAAALAVMSRNIRPFDATYADECLLAARRAYAYAADHIGDAEGTSGTPLTPASNSGGFYPANSRPLNAWSIAAAEMYMTTQEQSFLNTLNGITVATNSGEQNSRDVAPNYFFTFDFANNGELAQFVIGEAGGTNAADGRAGFKDVIESNYINPSVISSEGIYSTGPGAGQLRYVANAAFLISLYAKQEGLNSLPDEVFHNINFIMGDNSSNLSFIVGFQPDGVTSNAEHPHHRNVYLNENRVSSADNTLLVPARNSEFGAMVGGNRSPGQYNDTWNAFPITEVCVDYNCGLVGALAAIHAEINPEDPPSLVQCASPDLGADLSLCGSNNLTLNTGLSTANNRTFQWFRNGVAANNPQANATTFNITQGGTWRVVVDSAGECSRTDEIVISTDLPTVDLGEDVDLCSPASITLDAGVSGAALNFEWSLDGQVLSTETGSTLFVTEAGTYNLTISATGCPSESDEIVITSSLPEVLGDRFCPSAGRVAALEVLSAGGPFEWYDAETGGNLVNTGEFFDVSPASGNTTTFYVADAGSFESNVGATEFTGTAVNFGFNNTFGLRYTALLDFTIDALSISFMQIFNNTSASVSIDITNEAGDVLGTFTSNSTDVTQTSGIVLVEFTFPDFEVTPSIWGSNLIMTVSSNQPVNNFGNLVRAEGGNFSYPFTEASGNVTITGPLTSNNVDDLYGYFYNWQISSGADCDRVPVVAEVGCVVGVGDLEEVALVNLYPNPVTDQATLESIRGEDAKVIVTNLSGEVLSTFDLNAESSVNFGAELHSGVYLVQITNESNTQVLRFVKD